ncbi:DNA-3-methyladenine glycosylase I [Pseudoxanthobacter sp.]|uniref:DNA-3-methyladenine glycosylase I n=1 Tax=Pseudoxanthobacter sp. TaxID=1925742 RepID=UPI002FE0AE7F
MSDTAATDALFAAPALSPAPLPAGLNRGADGRARCFWCGDDPLYQAYHDTEWGRPTTDDRYLFEKICLEGFQSGLSWLTILRKRAGFRAAFAGFDAAAMAAFTGADVERLLQDAGIVRHRAKIVSAINNARCALKLAEEAGSIAAFLWRYEQKAGTRPPRITRESLAGITKSTESEALSKALKKRGWSFVGPTTMYAMMQAVGLVNDHYEGCHCREEALQARARLQIPG